MGGGETQARVAGHMGNSIFVAAYLILAVPFTLARILDAFTHILSDEDLDYADIIRSSIYIFTLAIQLIAIYWTRSRGPTLGLGVSIFTFVLILLVALRNASLDKGRLRLPEVVGAVAYVFVGILVGFAILQALISAVGQRVESLAGPFGSFAALLLSIGLNVLGIFILMAARRGWRWLWMAWILAAVFVGGWLALFNVADEVAAANPSSSLIGRVGQSLAEWQDLPAVGRFGQMLDTESRTAKVRVWIWQGTLELIKPHEPLSYPDGQKDPFNFLRPLLGYGPESMYVAYNSFYVPELATIEARNASPDRSHNETLDALVITGLAGFLAWQFLYLSLFYYGLRWLGVVRSHFDRNLLFALWFLGGIILTIIFVSWQGPEFFGVAFPFGNIAGLVLYLIYYALFARAQETGENQNPFRMERLLMIALVAAVLGHFVEIHFGIAIAATRLHFFVFAALMFLIGYRLPQMGGESVLENTAEPVTEEVVLVEEVSGRKTSRRRATRTVTTPSRTDTSWLIPIATTTLIMTLVVGTMGFEFMNFVGAPGEQIQTITDIPSAAEIMRRAFFINPDGFVDSPYIFLIIIFSWALGTLLGFSEIIKQGLLKAPTPAIPLKPERQRVIGFLFGLGFAFCLIAYGIGRGTAITGSPSQALGQSLLLIGAGLSLWGMLSFLLNQPKAHFIGTSVTLVGFSLVMPVLVAGSTLAALTIFVLCGLLLYLLWDKNWNSFFLPLVSLSLLSLLIGLAISYYQAAQLHNAFIAPPNVEQITEVERRIFEAERSTNYLDWFYFFVFSCLALFGTALGYARMGRGREVASPFGAASTAILLILALIIINITNVRVIHADIIYKRARPWDTAAIRERNPTYWDNSIGIYQRAIALAPNEDFYFLWLGRAYLEKSGLIQDATEREDLLRIAEAELKAAQNLNPLNTDHTANLARLYARWAGSTQGEGQSTLLAQAETYYQEALVLSPQNAVIRNEYGRLILTLGNDCQKALAIFSDSITIDPYYTDTHTALTQAYSFCKASLTEAEKATVLVTLEGAIPANAGNPSFWLQLGALYQEAEQFDNAVTAYETARTNATTAIPTWNVDYQLATLYFAQGDAAQARILAEQAMAAAPADATGEIQTFLIQLESEVIPLSEGQLVGEGEPRPLAVLTPAERNGYYSTYPDMVIDPGKRYDAVLITEKGEIRLRLFADLAPLSVNSFVFLATQGYYDGLTFHNVLENYIAQGGDPTATGQGGPGYFFNDEINNGLVFSRAGLLASPNQQPNQNAGQFFITMVPATGLNGRYTIFGELIEGMDVLQSLTIRAADTLTADESPGDVVLRVDIYEFSQ